MKGKMNFIAWLKKRKHEQNPVGDLARDVISDGFTGKSKLSLKRHMIFCGACTEAHDALYEAYERYKRERP